MDTRGNGAHEQTKSVLIIDDEKGIRDLYSMHLREEYIVRTASDASVPIERVENADIVFCDRRMPGQSGEAFLERVRSAGVDVPVVIVSAVSDDGQIDQQFQGYLTKPVRADTLRQSVEQNVAETSVRAG